MHFPKKQIYFIFASLVLGVGIIYFLQQQKTKDATERLADQQQIDAAALSRTSLPPSALANRSSLSATQESKKVSAAVRKSFENDEHFNKIGRYDNLELLYKLEEILSIESQGAEREQIAAELTQRLRKTADYSITDRIVDVLAAAQLSNDQQNYLLHFLGKLGTFDAMQALTALIPLLNDETARKQLAQVFVELGDSRWDTGIFAKIPHPLEQAWQKVTDDPLLEPALANALAGIGTANGIAFLLQSVDADYSSDRNLIIGNALAETAAPEALQLLAEILQNNDSNPSVAYVAGYALAYNGQELAARTLLNWASNAAEEESVQVAEWLRTAMNNSKEAANFIVKEAANKKFDSPAIQDVVNSLLAEYAVQ
ncbi:MAG: hypothetical protein D3923_14240 [Candidatus Electrothrix sp. AR3]|nr:hypothetical protein [Candidatus Electrothrix sp. AR3]